MAVLGYLLGHKQSVSSDSWQFAGALYQWYSLSKLYLFPSGSDDDGEGDDNDGGASLCSGGSDEDYEDYETIPWWNVYNSTRILVNLRSYLGHTKEKKDSGSVEN